LSRCAVGRRENGVRQETLLIRADANVAMGTGHVMRCLALAQAWQDAGSCAVFAVADATLAIKQRLQDEGMEAEYLAAGAGTAQDAKQTADIARSRSAAWVVIDGYQFGAEYQAKVKAAGLRLLFVDDDGRAEHYSADLVLNQNIRASEDLYANREPGTRLLLGPRYALLRREFRQPRGWRREIPARATKVLITMGGSDPGNVTAKVTEAVSQLSHMGLETAVLVGGSNPHLSSVKRLVRQQGQAMRLIHDAPDMAVPMAWADVAIAAAGTTFWEMCLLGLPSILLVLAENQRAIAEEAERLGVAVSLGDAANVRVSAIAAALERLLNSQFERMTRSDKGRDLVDGRGAERVLAFLSDLELRRTLESDCEVFWEWANDPQTRASSFTSKPISWEEHVTWFRARLADPRALLYTATNREGLPLGEVRYQIDRKRAALSISVGESFRRRGWGRKIMTVAAEQLFQDSEAEIIDAYVKPANEASARLFSVAGFQRSSTQSIDGQEAVHFVLSRKAGP